MTAEITWFRELPSTQDHARSLWTAGQLHTLPHAVVADHQLRGRGTQGRPWHSPLGGLWCTLVTRRTPAPTPPRVAIQIAVRCIETIIATLALHDHDAARLSVKWPNDLMIDERKFGGLLIEDTTGPLGHARLIGLGVNIGFEAGLLHEQTEWPATTLLSALARPMPLADLSHAVLDALADFRDDPPNWNDHAAQRLLGRGKRLVLNLPSPTGQTIPFLGTPIGIDDDGGLLLDAQGVVHTIRNGRIAAIEKSLVDKSLSA